MAIRQKNRNLIESAVETGAQGTNASGFYLCNNEVVEIGFPEIDETCHLTPSIFEKTIRRKIGGSGNFYLVVRYPLIPFGSIAVLLLSSFFLSLCFYLITRRSNKRFTSDILGALTDGILGNEELEILELEVIRKKIGRLRTLEIDTAKKDSRIKIGQQVVHDIRSPIGALKAGVQNLSRKPEISLEIIGKALLRIDNIINDLQSEDIYQGAPTKKFNLSNVINEIVAEKHAIHPRLVLKVPKTIDCEELPGDRQKILRVFSNILNNSIEACHNEKKIRIEVEEYVDSVKVLIHDKGVGVASENLSKVFERGFSSNKPGGSGMGLSYAKSVLEENAGSIAIDSEPDKGTTVTIEFSKLQPDLRRQ